MAAYIHFEYAVYMMPKAAKDPQTVLRAILSKKFADLKLVDAIPKQPQVVRARLLRNVQKVGLTYLFSALCICGSRISLT